jgi:ribosomal protein S12 methylthiotransferase
VIVAQDTTRYGLDLYGERRLPELLTKLCAIDGVEWIRLHYLYPDEVTDELIGVIANQPKIVRYLDIPIQHIDDTVLTKMNRRGTGDEIRKLFRTLRERIPGVVLRTTVITGLPGEGEAEFERLCEFLKETKIERAGVFVYSPEEGTPAAGMTGAVHFEFAEHRAALVADLQSRIMEEYNESRVGGVIDVLAESYDKWGECWVGRSYAEAPDVDGKIFFTVGDGGSVSAGDIVSVRLTDTMDGDLVGETADSDK